MLLHEANPNPTLNLSPAYCPPPRFLCCSGIFNDLGSGSNVDLCIISADKVDYLRNHEFLQGKTYSRQFPVRYPPGTARKHTLVWTTTDLLCEGVGGRGHSARGGGGGGKCGYSRQFSFSYSPGTAREDADCDTARGGGALSA
jgi:hypothetical protein